MSDVRKKQQAIFQYLQNALHGNVCCAFYFHFDSVCDDGVGFGAARCRSLFFLRLHSSWSFFYFVVFAAFFLARSLCVLCALMPYKIHMFRCAVFSACRLYVMLVFFFSAVCIFRMFHTRNCIPFGASICLQVLVADYLLSVLKYKHTGTAQFECARVCGAKKSVHNTHTHTHLLT